MTPTPTNHTARRRLSSSVCAAAGVFVAASAVPLMIAAAANADTITDAATAAVNAVDPSLFTPIVEAQTALDAVDTTGLSAGYLSILTGQAEVLAAQTDLLTQLGTFQDTLTLVDAGDLADLNQALLGPANDALLTATTAFTDSLDGGTLAEQLTTAFGLVGADFGAIGADLNDIGISATAEILNLFGISDDFLFAAF